MTKKEFVDVVANKTGIRQTTVAKVLNAMIDEIEITLKNGDKVQISGFGTFEAKEYAARVGRDLSSNSPMSIPQRVMPVFKVGRRFKERFSKGG